MEVILLQKVANLGGIGDRVKVRPGFARNFLLPQGKATMATPANIAKFEARRAELERAAQNELESAQQRAEKMRDLKLQLVAKAGTEGKLFGSIGTADIAEAAVAAGFEVARSEVRLPSGPIRVVGEHVVNLHLHTDVNVPVPVTIALKFTPCPGTTTWREVLGLAITGIAFTASVAGLLVTEPLWFDTTTS